MTLPVALILAYLSGAIPASYLAARLGGGIDLRRHGSRNLGATNLYRVLGLKYALPVALFDVLKGTIPVVVFSPWVGGAQWTPLVIGAAAILGHVFPIYLRFKGGKGVATAAGVMIGAAPVPFVVCVVVWMAVLATTRIMSLASVIGAAVFPIASAVFVPGNQSLVLAGVVIAGFIAFTHRANVRRLLAGTEPRLGKPKPAEQRG